MASIKLTSWNIEHFSRLIPNVPANKVAKHQGIINEITEIDPDILCMVEGPGNLQDLINWVQSPNGLNGKYHVAIIPGTMEILANNPPDPRAALQSLYAMKGNIQTGNQWVWFLVKDGLFQAFDAKVLNPQVWKNLTGNNTWPLHDWGTMNVRRHGYWRHPQTLILDIDGTEIEIIGVHLKSKINRNRKFDANGDLTQQYIDEALRARIDLATEAFDIRLYIEQRFLQDPNPRIFVCGDMNDGPGKEYFERQFLFFDLVSNIQGDIFFAKRFLNHALFDFDENLRWSTEFHDEIEDWARRTQNENLPNRPIDSVRFQLIDHILFTQGLVGANSLPRVDPMAGKVEHTIHQRINAMLNSSNKTSDHVPVSVTITIA
ncbi:MAG: endonuclease/exonuclease/phosphatase family protein [Bacteroidota bacterium]